MKSPKNIGFVKRGIQVYVAIDVGAESGRVMAGIWNDRKLRVEKQHRVFNGPVALGETIQWDVLRLWSEIQNGLALAGRKFHVIHLIGGGSQRKILNQFTADACQRPVMTGPVEATAIGNLLTQVRANGELGTLAEMREVFRKSSATACYEPATAPAWNEAVARFVWLRQCGQS